MTTEQRRNFKTIHPDARKVIILAQTLLTRRADMHNAESAMSESRSDLAPWEVGDGGKAAFEDACAQEEEAAKALKLAVLRFFGCHSSVPRADLETLLRL